jgi:hypothetical protein
VTVTAKDTTNASGSASFTWTIGTSGGGCSASQLLGNPGFETGSATPWTSTAGVINPNGAATGVFATAPPGCAHELCRAYPREAVAVCWSLVGSDWNPWLFGGGPGLPFVDEG